MQQPEAKEVRSEVADSGLDKRSRPLDALGISGLQSGSCLGTVLRI
jgi:hypothetical protein